MNQCLRQAQPLFHPPRESVDIVFTFVGEVQQLENIGDDLLATLTKEDPKEIGILPLGARRRNPDYVSAEVGKAERSAMMRLYL